MYYIDMDAEDSGSQRDSNNDLESTYKELPFVIKPDYRAFFLSEYWMVIPLLPLSCVLFMFDLLGLIVLGQTTTFGSILLSGVLVFLALLHAKIRLSFMGYELNRNAIVKRWGMVRRNTFNVPLEMVTDIGLKRETTDHLTGTATLLINTASAAGVVELPYLLLERAQKIEKKTLDLKRILFSKQGDGRSGHYPNPPPP